MSTDATASSGAAAQDTMDVTDASIDKGKGKVVPPDESMEDEEEEEDESEEEEGEEEEEEEDSLQEIDPAVILPPGARRSTRGAKVDYTSAEALAKAGLKPEDKDEDEEDDDVHMKED